MPRRKTAKKETPNVSNKKLESNNEHAQDSAFPVIGVGASAGGLKALKSFFAAVPENSDMAYIVISHMAANQKSLLPELLQSVTPIPVSTAIDGNTIKPNHIYIVPPGKEISIIKNSLQIFDAQEHMISLPIDFFLRSLALDKGDNAAAIILSGSGSDGTLGLKEIKLHNGLVLAQTETSAEYDSMPSSAIATGMVDFVMNPEDMPRRLVNYFQFSEINPNIKQRSHNELPKEKNWLSKIFTVLRNHTSHDFSSYKSSTILRRIERRMIQNQIENHEQYIRFLLDNSKEMDALFRELLIGVTNFFRDAASFETLTAKALPGVIENMSNDSTLRAWIPACSTGEEVFSLAMILREYLDTLPKRINIQLFGTDIDKFAIDKAREGIYPANIETDVSKERLRRFFIKHGNTYQVRKEIRDCAIFSVQDIIKDPPFSRLNILSCRNLLIYLNGDTQKMLLPLFHYTLQKGGILMLSSSETIGGFTDLFATLDSKWKIFKRQETPQGLRQGIYFPSGSSKPEIINDTLLVGDSHKLNITELAKNAILDQFTPTSILIDAKGEILYVQGRTAKYLETPSGPPTMNILDMVKEGLRLELLSAQREAKNTGVKVTVQRVAFKSNGEMQVVKLHVYPQHNPEQLKGTCLVVFEDVETESSHGKEQEKIVNNALSDNSKIAELERELKITREGHQSTIEQLESSNEELKSANEELQSSNEELQSTNEEMESSKEELQSLNEELQTVNAELENKIEELSSAHDDMHNLLNSTEIATIFVDNNICVRRYTPDATAIVNFIQADLGRPLKHVANNLIDQTIIVDIEQVLEKLSVIEREVMTEPGKWFHMRIIPYRTMDNHLDGAVLTFSSIDEQKKVQDKLQTSINEREAAWNLARSIFNMSEEPMLVLDNKKCVVLTNKAFADLMQLKQDEIYGKNFNRLNRVFKENDDLNSKLEKSYENGKGFNSKILEIDSSGRIKRMKIKASIIHAAETLPYRILLSIINVQDKAE